MGGWIAAPATRDNIVDWNGTAWSDVNNMTAASEFCIAGGTSNDTMIHTPTFDNYYNGTTSITVTSPSVTHTEGTWLGRSGDKLTLAGGGNNVSESWNGSAWTTNNPMPFSPSATSGDGRFDSGFSGYASTIGQCWAYSGDVDIYPNYPERQIEGDV